jgi:hypothetical protein
MGGGARQERRSQNFRREVAQMMKGMKVGRGRGHKKTTIQSPFQSGIASGHKGGRKKMGGKKR